MKRKIESLELMAREMVGDGQSPNLYFVSLEGVIITVTRDFRTAHAEWSSLPTNVETMLEDRKNGVICDTSPIEDGSPILRTYDDSHFCGLSAY